MGVVTGPPPSIPYFTLHELAIAKRKHGVGSKVIHVLESGDETFLPRLPIPFSQFFLSQDKVLCRYWDEKTETVEQFVIPEIFVPFVLKLLHDTPIVGYPGRDRTITVARRLYYRPKMCEDINNYVARCVTCAEHKGTAIGRAPMLQYRHLSKLGTLSQLICSNCQRADMAHSIFWCALTTFHVSWFLHQSKIKQQQV